MSSRVIISLFLEVRHIILRIERLLRMRRRRRRRRVGDFGRRMDFGHGGGGGGGGGQVQGPGRRPVAVVRPRIIAPIEGMERIIEGMSRLSVN